MEDPCCVKRCISFWVGNIFFSSFKTIWVHFLNAEKFYWMKEEFYLRINYSLVQTIIEFLTHISQHCRCYWTVDVILSRTSWIDCGGVAKKQVFIVSKSGEEQHHFTAYNNILEIVNKVTYLECRMGPLTRDRMLHWEGDGSFQSPPKNIIKYACLYTLEHESKGAMYFTIFMKWKPGH